MSSSGAEKPGSSYDQHGMKRFETMANGDGSYLANTTEDEEDDETGPSSEMGFIGVKHQQQQEELEASSSLSPYFEYNHQDNQTSEAQALNHPSPCPIHRHFESRESTKECKNCDKYANGCLAKTNNHAGGCASGAGDRMSNYNTQYGQRYSRSPPRPSLIPGHKLSLSEDGYDRIDALPSEMKFTWLDALAILFSIGSFLFDIGTDIAVAIIHYSNQDYWFFGLTLTFIVIPTLVMTGISLRWYVLDAREEGSAEVTSAQWTLRVIFLLLQLGPILRYIDSLIYGIKFMRNTDKLEQKKYYHYMVYEDTDATMLRLFECFMEAAPQLVLQIYILAVHKSPLGNDHLMVLTQMAACVASLVSLSWSLVSYQRSLRLSLPNKVSLTWQGIAVQFLWRFFVIAARVLALALFAAVYNWHISIVCGVHCSIMFCWIVSMKTSFCENRCEELGYNAVLAVMYIFCYFNPVDSPTRYRYAIYYTFMFTENTLLMMFWFTKAEKNLWYRIPALAGHYLSFFTGLLFMAAYYLLFHPSGDIKVFRNRDIDQEETARQKHARRGGYKRQTHNGLWTTQGRVLHPRPAVPTTLSPTYSEGRISKPRRASNCMSQSSSEKINRNSSKGTNV